jgi:hypothetical protein
MTTNYSGTIDVSGSLQANNGTSGTFSGALGVTLSATLDPAGSGEATETVAGNIYAQYTYANGSSGSDTIPFDFSTPDLPFQSGNFQIDEHEPVAIKGVEFGVMLNGSVSSNQSDISENILATASGTYQGIAFSGTVSASGSLSGFVPCYLRGTRIATPVGERAIETLAAGDLVLTASGEARPIAWIGHRRVDCRRHPQPENVWPVRVHVGAFGGGLPHRDLFLSPDHAVFLDGVLIPVRYLINGASIVQEAAENVSYWHVELDRHDVIFAEGLPCETFLDTGNRAAFANGGASVQMHPDFALKVWEAKACAKLVLGGPRLTAAKRRLLAQAACLGHATTDDPDLKVLVDSREVFLQTDGRQWRVRLPEVAKSLRLVSRAWIPAHMRPDEDDPRKLGVAISRIWLDGREISLESPGLCSGWHAAEPGWRWTDGDAALALTGVRELAFELAMTGTYWQDQRSERSLDTRNFVGWVKPTIATWRRTRVS